jgi:hypothetical protein
VASSFAAAIFAFFFHFNFSTISLCRRHITVTCARGVRHPTYDVEFASGDPPQTFTLTFRNVSFRDLSVATVGELNLPCGYPPTFSKWKRFITLTEADLFARASSLDAWMRALFGVQAAWTPLVAVAAKTFMESALDTAGIEKRRQVGGRSATAQAQTFDGPLSSSNVPSRSFAAFLSHFKLECGTEARLVHGQLPKLLPLGSPGVFLDSGE